MPLVFQRRVEESNTQGIMGIGRNFYAYFVFSLAVTRDTDSKLELTNNIFFFIHTLVYLINFGALCCNLPTGDIPTVFWNKSSSAVCRFLSSLCNKNKYLSILSVYSFADFLCLL